MDLLFGYLKRSFSDQKPAFKIQVVNKYISLTFITVVTLTIIKTI